MIEVQEGVSFQELQAQILRSLWASDPVSATSLGIHDYDNHYGRYDADSRQKKLLEQKGFVQALEQVVSEELSPDEQLDHKLLRSHLLQQIHLEEHRHYLQINPALYPEEALFGVQQLQINYRLTQDQLEQRVVSIINRLLDMPRLLQEGRANLEGMEEDIPQEWVEIALDSVKAGRRFLEDIVPQFSGTVPQYFRELLDSNTVALRALQTYEKFLNHMLPQSNGTFACGKEYFNFVLKERYLLPDTAEDVLEMAKESIQHTEKMLQEVAHELDPSKTWEEIIAQLKNKHPKPNQLLQYYTHEANRILDFVNKNEILTMPASETLVLMETPIFQWNIMPYSAYVTPAPFDDHQLGYFWVTPVHHSMSEAEQWERLRDHNVYDIVLTTVNQAYPGQHVQFVRANQNSSAVRKTLHDPITAAGWSFYCEEMMYTEELYSDLKTRLFQLKDQLWREYRAVIDIQLHLGEMEFREAVEMLMEQVKLDYNSAQAEVKRYSLFPTIGMGYFLGKREIIKLRQEIAEREGDDFSLKHFHDRLLNCGIIPLSLIREKMLADALPEDGQEPPAPNIATY